jgi:hypothetical protein
VGELQQPQQGPIHLEVLQIGCLTRDLPCQLRRKGLVVSSEVSSKNVFPFETTESTAGRSVAVSMEAEVESTACSLRMLGSDVASQVSIESECLHASAYRAFVRPIVAPSMLAASLVSSFGTKASSSAYLYKCR